ncbi:sigma-70 family RNA polymerase sigma factor [Myxacorys almedinensis]|uniref:Sigma-70 family RNA polymerase sigma factor n=1 Tax=Myxacorys almedinensis A TaxID=2690445 RepID=A0A8J7YWY5_9CYAN|nr:sigma-70 family RNA polymerase sigma factor [Myxacorys almedinensis]NDJ16182.1 sigma-70 family RNA polymerase sigma factor [Myxacorys almedinensis A]
MDFEQSQPSELSSPSETDATLYRALKSGQTEALGMLYDRHAGLVYGIALKILTNPQEAEDLTQDIFLTLANKCSFDPARGSLRTFLGILTRSRSIDRVRSRQTSRESLRKWQTNHPPDLQTDSTLEHAFQTEQSQEVSAALAQLSADQQQILRMAYYDGLSQSEIAERLELPLGTVKTRARRGLMKLRQTLTNDAR